MCRQSFVNRLCWISGLVSGMLHVGSIGNGLCLSGLTCGFITLFTPCISGTLMPLDFAWDLVCIRYLFVSVSLNLVMLSI